MREKTMLSRHMKKLGVAVLAVMLFAFMAAPTARAKSLLDEMQVPDTCGTTYADKLASCTPFRCTKPSPMAMMFGFPSEDEISKMPPERQQKIRKMKAAAEKKMAAMSPQERAAMKARMASALEIKGYDAQGRCQTEASVMPNTLMRCAYDALMLKRVSDFQKIAAKADHVESHNSSRMVDGKWVSKTITKVDGKVIDNPMVETLSNGTCKTLKKDTDRGWVTLDQINRMAHIDLNLSERGKHVPGHVRVLNTSDGKVVFDKDVATDKGRREINLDPGTYDIEISSKNSELAPVWDRGIKLGKANVFKKNVEFYAIIGILKLTVNVNGQPANMAVYMNDPETHQWLALKASTFGKKPSFYFKSSSIKLPETLAGKYEFFVTPVIHGFEPPANAKYKKFLLTIKNGDTVEKTVNFDSITGGTKAAGNQTSNLVPLRLYRSEKNQDNFVTATRKGVKEALAAGYRFSRIEACIIGVDTKLSERSLGSAALKLFWSSNRGDHFSAASSRGEHDAMAAGYQFVRTEGFILPVKQPGTVPLKLYWSSGRKDNFSTASQQGIHDAEAAGYRYARIQGYVYPPSKCQSKASHLPEGKVDVVAGKTIGQIIPVKVKPVASIASDANAMEQNTDRPWMDYRDFTGWQ